MRIVAPPVALPLLAALGCVTPAAGPVAGATVHSASGGAPVPMTFAWPDGFQARVTLEHRQERSGGPTATARATHQLVAERRGRVIRVFVRDVEAEGDVPDL